MKISLHKHRSENPVPAVFLDRDGTINVEKNYLYQVQDWEWISGAREAIKLLRDCGFLVVVITNQSGIARGYYTSDDVSALHRHVDEELLKIGAGVDAYYWCSHHPDFGSNCNCRKPSPGMILQAVKDLNINVATSWMVGDKAIDIQAGLAAGVKSLLVQTGYGVIDMKKVGSDVPVFNSLIEAALHIKTCTLKSGVL